MSNAAKNTIVRSVAPKSVFEDATDLHNTTIDYDQGDFLVYDAATQLLVKPAAETEGVTMLGIAPQTVVDGQPKSPYSGTAVDASQKTPRLAGPIYGVVARCVAKTGEAYTRGCLVYLHPATGGRGVQVTGTKAIGVYQGPAIASSAAGQEVEVLIGARYPGDTLQF